MVSLRRPAAMRLATLFLAAAVTAAAAAAAASAADPVPGTTCPCIQEADPQSSNCYHWATPGALPAVGSTAACTRVACAPRYVCVAQPVSTHVCRVTAVTSVPVCPDAGHPTTCDCLRTGVSGPTHLTPVQVRARAGPVGAPDPPLDCGAGSVPVVRVTIEDKPFKCVKEVNLGALSVRDAYFGGGNTTRQSGWRTNGDWVHVHFLTSTDGAVPHGVCFTNGGGRAAVAEAPGDRGVDVTVTTPSGNNSWVVRDPASGPSPFNATFGYTTMQTADGLVQAARQSWPNGGPGRGFCVRMPASGALGVKLSTIKWLRGLMVFGGGVDYPLSGPMHIWCASHSATARGLTFPHHWGRTIFPVPAGTPADNYPTIDQVTFQRACDCGSFPV